MADPMLARAQLAIEEGERLRSQRRTLTDAFDEHTAQLRRAIYESASARMERKALRDNKE
ncbi:hypothetical protein [Bradyrhizobium sp. USDA 3256]